MHSRTSDDNLLKNIELFDKLSLRFNGRVLFIKDVIGSSEICCWTFYGHEKKVAEVCCTSIVYATDKKHTKVSSGWEEAKNDSINDGSPLFPFIDIVFICLGWISGSSYLRRNIKYFVIRKSHRTRSGIDESNVYSWSSHWCIVIYERRRRRTFRISSITFKQTE